MTLPFVKYQGCGNDFILFDWRASPKNLDADSIQALCHRHLGIGADGILCLFPSCDADLQVVIYNKDGSVPAFCGNGLRCVGQYLHDQGCDASLLDVAGKQIAVSYEKGLIAVQMPFHKALWGLTLDGMTLDFLDTGVPHAVLLVDNLDTLNLEKLGPHLRHHSTFAPDGANATFVQVLGSNQIATRTYERGVEGETLACGSGATAAALAACQNKKASSPVTVNTGPGQQLTVSFHQNAGSFSSIFLKGPAKKVFEGSAPISLLKESALIR